MYKSKIIQWGKNSQALGLPKSVLDMIGLKIGDEVAISISTKGNIVITNLDGTPLVLRMELVEE